MRSVQRMLSAVGADDEHGWQAAEARLRATAQGLRDRLPDLKAADVETTRELVRWLVMTLDGSADLVEMLIAADRLARQDEEYQRGLEAEVAALRTASGDSDRTAEALKAREQRADERRRQAQELRANGLSISQIALKMQRPERSVSRWLAKKS